MVSVSLSQYNHNCSAVPPTYRAVCDNCLYRTKIKQSSSDSFKFSSVHIDFDIRTPLVACDNGTGRVSSMGMESGTVVDEDDCCGGGGCAMAISYKRTSRNPTCNAVVPYVNTVP